MDFAIRVMAWRKWLRMSQAKLAELCGVRQTTISHWECGANTPTLEMLHLLVTKALGTTMHRFWSHLPKARKAAKASARAQAAA